MIATHSPAFLRAIADAGDDEDQRKLIAVAEVLWRETQGDVALMLVLMGQLAAMLSAAYGPETAAIFRKAFDEGVGIAKRCIGPSVADQPEGTA
jgi:hypothetical protein